MKDEQYLFIENTLRELAMYIHNCKVTEEKEKFKKQFSVVYDSSVAPMRDVDASKQKKKRNRQNVQVWTAKEIKDMPYLKDLKYRITKDGIHQFRYRRDGYNVSFNSKRLDVAKQKAYSFIKGLNGILQRSADLAYGKTLGFVAEAWLELKQRHVARDSFRVYQGIYYNHIAPTFANKSVKSILPMHLQPFFDSLFEKQERTCEDAKIVLSSIFKYAVANRLIPSNPMDGVIVSKHFRKTGKALTDEQIAKFKSHMLTQGNYGIATLIILYSGIRGHELNSLTFDWENGTFTVNNAKLKKSQKAKEENLKRTVPIFPGLYALKERIEEYDETWKLKSSTLSSKLNVHGWSESTIKDLRHTFASKAREAGVENELVNLWTGHLPGKNVTANIYTHFSMEFQKKQAEKVDNY